MEGDTMTKAHGVRVTLASVMCVTALVSAMNLAQTAPNAPAPIAQLVPRIDALVQRYMQDAHIPGSCTVLFGTVVWNTWGRWACSSWKRGDR
jgi:hypothetical protein